MSGSHHRLQQAHQDSTNHLGDTPKEETTQLRRCRPNRSPVLGFAPVLEAGKNEQRHDNASKEVTAPVGVALVRFMQGFHPALPSTPTPSDTLQGSPLGSPPTRSEPEMPPRSRRVDYRPTSIH
jgi:hypothetical protein